LRADHECLPAAAPQQCLKYDQRMYLCDVRGSIAYSKALLKVGIVSEHEQREIERGLGEVAKEWEEKRVRPLGSNGRVARVPLRV
jgi:argininosuccinate lyase